MKNQQRNKNKIRTVFTLVVFVGVFGLAKSSFAGTCWDGGSTGVAPWYVKNSSGNDSLDQLDVNACILNAAENDTVYLPAGEGHWSGVTTLDKGIILIGATTGCPENCVDNTVIYPDRTAGSSIIYASPADMESDPFIRITGITFDGRLGSYGYPIYVKNQDPIYDWTNFRLDHCNFKNSGHSYQTLYMRGEVFGLIDHNAYYDNLPYETGVYNFNLRGNWNASWSKHPQNDDPSSDDSTSGKNFMYIEDNIFYNRTYMVNNGGEGARFIFRHNNFKFDPSATMWNVHGDTSNRGVIAWGMYENIVEGPVTGQSSYKPILAQGGNGIFYNNVLNNYSYGNINIMENYPDCTYSQGCANSWDGQDGINNTYIFGNTNPNYGSPPRVWDEDVMYFNSGGTYEPQTSDSLLGETSGTTASLYIKPTLTSGSWATGDAAGKFTAQYINGRFIEGEQLTVAGNADTFTLASPQHLIEKINYWDDYNNISRFGNEYFTKDIALNRTASCFPEDVYWETDTEKLYRCIAPNTWTLVYTPYTYPHPLQNLNQSFRGDVDGSLGVTTVDALLTLRKSLGMDMSATSWQTSTTTGDVDCNGVTNSTDALLILRYSIGMSMENTAWCE